MLSVITSILGDLDGDEGRRVMALELGRGGSAERDPVWEGGLRADEFQRSGVGDAWNTSDKNNVQNKILDE